MKILLVIDGSTRSEAALSFGALIAQRTAEPPTLLVVIDPLYRRTTLQAEDILERASEVVNLKDINCLVRHGNPFEQIMFEASEGGYDLVIMGDRKPRNLIKRFVWRSTAVRVAEGASASVIVVRGKIGMINRILLCDSGIKHPSLLSQLVVQLGDVLQGEEDVTVLHVMSQLSAGPGVRGKNLRAGAKELIQEQTPEGDILERDIQLLEKLGIRPTPKVRHGLVVDEILAEASSGDYDLVVVGAHPSAGKQRFLLDNIAHQILKKISRPILVVRNNHSTNSLINGE